MASFKPTPLPSECEQTIVTFQLDSGAAVSVIHLNTLSSEYRNSYLSAGAPIGANGSPLDNYTAS